MRKSFYCYQIHFSYASFSAIFVIAKHCLTDNIAGERRARTGSCKWKIYRENQSTRKSSVPITDISWKMRSLIPSIIVWRDTSLSPLILLESFTT